MTQSYHKTSEEEALYEAGELPEVNSPPRLNNAALYGLAGRFVHALSPHTEADPAAILGQVLVTFGVACGRSPHLVIDGSRHGVNEFAVMVGASSKARKGTGWSRTRETLFHADPDFFDGRVKGGLSSGEGLIYHVRDAVETFDQKKCEMVLMDPGIDDKRLLVTEEEFASVLKMLERDGNSLSPVLRIAWDGGKLSPLTKSNRIEATNAHIGMIGHITEEELKRRLTETESANGFGNRILWLYVHRSQLLPLGGNFQEVHKYGDDFRSALNFARNVGEMKRSADFDSRWKEVYPVLSEATPGLAGQLTSRSEAHALRLSMIFALMDRSDTIRSEHLTPALSIIDYVQDSVAYIFGAATGDPLADKITEIVSLQGGSASMMEIYSALKGHGRKDQIERAITRLVQIERIEVMSEKTDGRPRQILKARR